nr:uncharacterized protein LOC109157655 [Ipomoea trifida]
MDEEEVEEADNKKDFDVDYDTSLGLSISGDGTGGNNDIAMVHYNSFVSTQGWDSEKIVDYRLNEDKFHKISLHDCDFVIRKPPDPDNDVYDFCEMYVTPPDTDVYAISRFLRQCLKSSTWTLIKANLKSQTIDEVNCESSVHSC